MKRPLIIAHRGASALATENSMAALEAAIVHGADVAEFDIRLSRDGVPICSHDADLVRLMGRTETVGSLDAAELVALGLLPLATLVDRARRRIPLLLDSKAETRDFFAAVTSALGEAAADREAIVVGVRSLAASRVAREFLPCLPQLGLLADKADFATFVAEGGSFNRLWESDADTASIARMRALGRPVWITLGAQGKGDAGEASAAALAQVLALEPDGILINDPRRLIAARAPQAPEVRAS